MTDCAVNGCSTNAETIFAPDLGADIPLMEWAACRFHLTALQAGEPWSEEEGEERPTILMGSDLPPDVINVIVQRDVGPTPTITLVLGRDGVEEQRVSLRWARESIVRILDWLE